MTAADRRAVDADPGRPRRRPTRAGLATGLALAPAAWVFHFLAGISLVAVACDRGSESWLHVSTLVALPVGLAGLWAALRLRAELQEEEAGNAVVGTTAVALAVLSVALIVVEQLVVLPLEPCA